MPQPKVVALVLLITLASLLCGFLLGRTSAPPSSSSIAPRSSAASSSSLTERQQDRLNHLESLLLAQERFLHQQHSPSSPSSTTPSPSPGSLLQDAVAFAEADHSSDDLSHLTLWSTDFHISPIADLKHLLSRFGVRVIDKSLSGACSSKGTCATDLKVINGGNAYDVGGAPGDAVEGAVQRLQGRRGVPPSRRHRVLPPHRHVSAVRAVQQVAAYDLLHALRARPVVAAQLAQVQPLHPARGALAAASGGGQLAVRRRLPHVLHRRAGAVHPLVLRLHHRQVWAGGADAAHGDPFWTRARVAAQGHVLGRRAGVGRDEAVDRGGQGALGGRRGQGARAEGYQRSVPGEVRVSGRSPQPQQHCPPRFSCPLAAHGGVAGSCGCALCRTWPTTRASCTCRTRCR